MSNLPRVFLYLILLRMITDSRRITTASKGLDPNLKILDDEADAKRWEGLNKKGELLTKETYESWTGELQNLLIFAGLFSGIVTAFTIEAAKAVQGDPAEKTVLLLQTMIQQLNNQSNPQPNMPINLNPEATPSLYAQRINALYSVSLALSLVAVVGGIVCLQWLRQFGKNITGVSNKDDLLLQYQRHESLQSWGVLALLNMLPLFLLLALGLFFVGFMVSQWESKSLASIPITVLVAILGTFILFTSILPTGQLIWRTFGIIPPQKSPPVLCPYRSPQSWLFHLLLRGLTYVLRLLLFNAKFQWLKHLEGIRSWMDYDARGVKRWKESVGAVRSIYHQLSWISQEYRQTTKVAEDAYCCMFFASCQKSRMKLRGREHDIRWKWEEQDLFRLFMENNDNGVRWMALCTKGIVEAHAEYNTSEKTGVQAWLESVDVPSSLGTFNRTGFIEEIVSGLRRSDTTWVTLENAVAIVCDVIDHNWLGWDMTYPILVELCKHPRTSLPHIRHLVNKYLDADRGSEHDCRHLVSTFTQVFSSVDSADYDVVAPILGDLLVECDKCIIYYHSTTDEFLEIIQNLALKCLIGKDKSLDRIFLYTKKIIQHSDELYRLPLFESTFSAILSAAEEHLQDSPSTDSVLHPDKFNIPRTLPNPDLDEDLNPVWALIDDFNNKLKELWRVYEDIGSSGERLGRMEHIRTSGDEDLQDKTPGLLASTIQSTTVLPIVATPKPIKSNSETNITPIVTVSPILPLLSQGSEHHSSDNNSIDPHTGEGIPLVQFPIKRSGVKQSSGSGQFILPLPSDISTSQDSHFTVHPLKSVVQVAATISQDLQTA